MNNKSNVCEQISSLCNHKDHTTAIKNADDVKAYVSLHNQFCRNGELEARAICEFFFLILGTLIKHVTFCDATNWTETGSEQTVENPA